MIYDNKNLNLKITMRKKTMCVAMILAMATSILAEITPENVSSLIVDDAATTETVALFYNLHQTSKGGTIVGQHDGYSRRTGEVNVSYSANTDIFTTTGKRPKMSGEDLMFLTDDKYDASVDWNWFRKQVAVIKESVEKSYDEHGVFTAFTWHFREPYAGKSFYASELAADVKKKAFKSILPEGEKHDYYKAKLDLIADFFKSLKDKNGNPIPVIFRPFHEMEGNWFWWGIPHYATAEEYKQLWQFTVKYLRDDCDVHNVLYAFAPDKQWQNRNAYLTCYPGDDYVDILGFDSYENYSKNNYLWTKTKNQIGIIDRLAKEKNKLAALTECGYQLKDANYAKIDKLFSEHYYGVIEKANTDLAFVMFWSGSSFVPTKSDDSKNLAADLTMLFEQDGILSESNMEGSLFVLPTEDTGTATQAGIERASLYIALAKGGLTLVGAPMGELVEVYNLSGVRIAAEKVASSQHFIAVQSGVYIVRMGDQVRKIVL